MRSSRLAPVAAALALLTIYLATLAPDVTFWDAGEFIAAAQTLGIPHPPGTPLYVLTARVWRILFQPLPPAVAVNLLSAVATAVAGGLSAALVTRATGSRAYGLAGAVAAGTMSTAWLNATETEVYALSLCLSLLMVWAGDEAGQRADARWVVLTGYLIALAVPLHLSALVAAPAAVLLAASRPGQYVDSGIALALGAVTLLSAGVGTGRADVAAAGGVALLAAALWGPSRPHAPRLAMASVIASSGLLFLLVRARHDPPLNQGNPSTLPALRDVVARRQYALAPLWPRQAPVWIQAGNLLEYADWQVGLALAPGPPPSPWRTPLGLAAVALAVIGARLHRRRDPRTWRAHMVLLACGTVGVLAYLNLKAGPSIGYGILPDEAPHEARERDYFYALGFWAWGVWAGMGCVALLEGRGARGRALGVALAAVPVLVNWRAVDRRREPDASTPRRLAGALLRDVPANAVLLVAGDNDTYPLWYLQAALGQRRDVTVVTLPLLGADWYREEMARRHGLLGPPYVEQWYGTEETTREIGARAVRAGRPIAASPSLTADERNVLPGWEIAGTVYRSTGGHEADGAAPAGTLDGSRFAVSDVTRRAAAASISWLRDFPPGRYTDYSTTRMRAILACPVWAVAADTSEAAKDSLASLCNLR